MACRHRPSVLLVVGIGLAACASRLPSQRPADLAVTMMRGGGHASEGRPVKEIMIIDFSGESTYRIEYEGGGAISVVLSPGEDDLEEIYLALRKSKFDQISTYKGSSRHKGAIVTVEWEDNEITVRDTGKSFVSEGWREEWESVLSILKAFKKRQIEEADIDLPAEFDPALVDNLELEKGEE